MLRDAARTFTRPYPITLPMLLLFALVPAYIFIAAHVRSGPLHRPALALDDAIPLVPEWSLVYGALYLYLILLPVLMIRDPEHVRRMFWAYVAIWLTAYVVFLIYPTAASRPGSWPAGGDFGDWGLRSLYAMDPPYNCFPSLHVAHSFVSALAVWRLHKRAGIAAMAAASTVAVSTLFTKQHYVLDIVTGIPLAFVAYFLILHPYARDKAPPQDQRLAPVSAIATAGLVAVFLLGYWIVYRVGVEF